MKVVFAVGVVTLVALLGYLAYMQHTSQNKKIKVLNSSVVELQGQVKELQKQVNNNVSFGTQQSLDALIHQIESEIDSQTNANDIPEQEHENRLLETTQGKTESQHELQNEQIYDELETELTQELSHDMNEMFQDSEPLNISLIDNELDEEVVVEEVEAVEDDNEEDKDEDDKEEEEDEEEEDEEEEEEEEEEDEEEEEEEDEEEEDEEEDLDLMGEDCVQELQNEVEDDFMEKLSEFYLSKTQAELRSLCRKHKKPFSGNKQTLVTRILEVEKLRNVSLE